MRLISKVSSRTYRYKFTTMGVLDAIFGDVTTKRPTWQPKVTKANPNPYAHFEFGYNEMYPRKGMGMMDWFKNTWNLNRNAMSRQERSFGNVHLLIAGYLTYKAMSLGASMGSHGHDHAAEHRREVLAAPKLF